MSQPLTVTVDSAKGIAKMSGPLVLGNSYQVSYSGVSDGIAETCDVVVLGVPQLTDQWESGNPEVRIAAMTDSAGILAMTTQELVAAFRALPQPPPPPVPPRDPRNAVPPIGVALNGPARPHGAIRLHFYVTASGTTLGQGDCTVLWAPFEYDGTGTPIVLQGPKGDKGEQGEKGDKGDRGSDAVIATSTGCVTFKVDTDPESETYGHLLCYADNDYELYHDGDTSRPHWWLGTGTNGGTAGHLYYTYYPADPATAPSTCDLGMVIPADSGAAFAARLKTELESNVGALSAINLNTAIALGNAIKNALFGVTQTASALLLAFLLPFLFAPGEALAEGITPSTLGDMNPNTPVYSAAQTDAAIAASTNGYGSGSLKSVWGPSSFTNQAVYATNLNAETLGIKPAESNANIRIQYDPETSTYSLQAIGGIPGPQGADGIGNVHWAGEWYRGMIMSNANTWVTYDGSIWTRAPSSDPILTPPTNNATWTKVVSRGHDGEDGSDGHDGVGLQFVEWSTNLTQLTPDMLISYGGYLLMITNGAAIENPGYPVVNKLPVAPYKAIVRPGADGGTAVVYTNAAFIVDFDLNTAVPARSLVAWQGYLWYARQDYIPNVTPSPATGAFWECLGRQGERGPQGANGIGNLRYMGAWIQYRTNEVNDIVRWTRADGKVDWYRATGMSAGARPDINTNLWSKEITSGTDANTVEWKFVDGPYDHTVSHSNELHRMPDGRVWYSVGVVPAGEGYSPGRNASAWHLFVRDGTSVASNTVWRGEWQLGVDYGPGDMVTRQFENGAKSLFICTNATDNYSGTISPPDVRCWAEIASGIQGATGAKGADGTATYITHTNLVTYEHVYETNITTIVTNDQTTAIRDYDVPSTVYNSVKFDNRHFDFDLSQSTFSLTEAALGVGTFSGWTGDVTLNAGTNISISKDDSRKTLAINAIVPEVDLAPVYAAISGVQADVSTRATTSALNAVSSRVGTIEQDYITSEELANELENYAPAGDITIITNDIGQIVSALSHPVVKTPDNKQWTMQGRYVSERVTHVWVPYVGGFSTSIRVPMPDGRIFEMAGRYADGDTNRVTHVWTEVVE